MRPLGTLFQPSFGVKVRKSGHAAILDRGFEVGMETYGENRV